MTSQSPAQLFLSAFSSPPTSRIVLPKADEEGSRLNGYRLGKVIGHGGFSTIRLATSDYSAELVAIKISPKGDRNRQLERERIIWSSLSHEHILPLFSWVSSDLAMSFVTMYCPAGSLFDLLKSNPNGLASPILQPLFAQLVSAFVYLHTQARIVHRDLKLENVLIDDGGGVRVGDFGLARKIDEEDGDADGGGSSSSDDDDDGSEEAQQPAFGVHRTMSLSAPHHSSLQQQSVSRKQSLNLPSMHPSLMRQRTLSHKQPKTAKTKTYGQPGSLPYAAPELLNSTSHPLSESPRRKAKRRMDPAQDIWALGVVLHALLTGRLPWSDSFEPRLVWRIVCGPYTLPEAISPNAARILLGCVERDLSKRWTIRMVDELAWGVSYSPAGSNSASLSRSRSRRHSPGSAGPTSPTSHSHSRSRTSRSRRRRSPTPASSTSPPPGLSFSVQSVQSLLSDVDIAESPCSPTAVRFAADVILEDRGRKPHRLFPSPPSSLSSGSPSSSPGSGLPGLSLSEALEKSETSPVEGLPFVYSPDEEQHGAAGWEVKANGRSAPVDIRGVRGRNKSDV